MKYLKTYEKHKIEYNSGDYVLLNIKKIIKELKPNEYAPTDSFAYIDYISYNNIGEIYEVKLSDYDEHEIYQIKENEIIRKLTKEEIKIFKEKQKIYRNAKKYNI